MAAPPISDEKLKETADLFEKNKGSTRKVAQELNISEGAVRIRIKNAKLRGIILVPELEVPGHATQLVKIYPEIFRVNNNNPNSNVVDISNEKVYTALDEIIGEMIEVFYTSPYFHIGADEANLDLYRNVPEIRRFMKKNNLGTDVNELYRYFIVRMNEIVKSHNKTTPNNNTQSDK